MNTNDLLTRLQQIKERYGDAAYQEACCEMAQQFLDVPGGEVIAQGMKASETPTTPSFGGPSSEAMLQMFRSQMPNVKTQAQLNLFMAGFEALKLTMGGYFGGNLISAEMARNTLTQVLDAARDSLSITEKLNEMPDELKSATAKDFNQPAKELHEDEEVKTLLAELETINDTPTLQKWYDDNKSRFDRLVSSKFRNEVFDAIRVKRKVLLINDHPF